MRDLNERNAALVMGFVASDPKLAYEWDSIGVLYLQGHPPDLVFSRMGSFLQKACELYFETDRQMRTLEQERAGQC